MSDSDSDTPNAGVQLDFEAMFCRRHLEPLRTNWPSGALLAIMGMFNAAAADPRMGDLAGGDANNLTALLRIVAPVCCWLPEGQAEAVVDMALAGQVYGKA